MNCFLLSSLLVIADETEIVQPFLLGCDTKSLRVVQISITALQRLITNEALSEVCSSGKGEKGCKDEDKPKWVDKKEYRWILVDVGGL